MTSLRKAAKSLGKSVTAVKKQLNKAGIDTSHGVDVEDAKRIHQERAALDSNPRNAGASNSMDILLKMRARKLDQEYKIKAGLLISKEEVLAEQDATNEIIRSDLTAFPNKVASRLVNIKNMQKVSEILREELVAMVRHWQEGGIVGQEAMPK